MTANLRSGPFRIIAPLEADRRVAAAVPAGASPEAAPGGAPSPGPQKQDQYFDRLLKLVPTEVLALYITFKEVATGWLGIWAAICLVLVVFVRTIGTSQAGKPVQVVAVVVATVSFILWVYATGGYILQFKLPENMPGVISVAVGVWTFLVPYFYKGEQAP
jgi:hypothetical protein